MAKKPNTVGGGARTNSNGLPFEGRTDLRAAIRKHPIYHLGPDEEVLKGGRIVAYYYEKHGLYRKLLEPRGINYKTVLSKKLLPDGALLVDNTLYIIEKKYQEGSGSVDEKLQTCDFKKKQYQKLFKPLGIDIEFYYVLNKWFEQEANRDVFEYIQSVGCKYFIEELPLNEIGL